MAEVLRYALGAGLGESGDKGEELVQREEGEGAGRCANARGCAHAPA